MVIICIEGQRTVAEIQHNAETSTLISEAFRLEKFKNTKWKRLQYFHSIVLFFEHFKFNVLKSQNNHHMSLLASQIPYVTVIIYSSLVF